jgi:Ca2+:H+ antiporter
VFLVLQTGRHRGFFEGEETPADHAANDREGVLRHALLLIALVVFTPEGVSALIAAYGNELQRTVNLCLGACLSTVGLTLPAVVAAGLITGKAVILGLDPTGCTCRCSASAWC